MQELKDFWSKYEPYKLHPNDEEHLSSYKDELCLNLSIEEMREQYGNDLKNVQTKINFEKVELNKIKLLTNLIPVPFAGDVLNAKLYILTLNPGFTPGVYIDEHEDTKYIELAKQNLRLELKTFKSLHEDAKNTEGYKYWSKKGSIPNIVEEVSRLSNTEYDESFKFTKDNLAVIESVAYHSTQFAQIKNKDKLLSMSSSQLNKKFVHDYVMKRVRKNEAMVFVWRGADFWDLWDFSEEKNLIIREKKNAQKAILFDNEIYLISKIFV